MAHHKDACKGVLLQRCQQGISEGDGMTDDTHDWDYAVEAYEARILREEAAIGIFPQHEEIEDL